MTKEIELTQGQKALVDDEDFEWLSQWKWYAHWSKNVKSYYVYGGRYINKKTVTFHMAREIMKTPKGLLVDHINHNTLDNRKANLRNVTYSENQMNKIKHSNNGNKYKGITPHRSKYQAKITINGITRCLGSFDTQEEASSIYQEAARKYFGEYRLKD